MNFLSRKFVLKKILGWKFLVSKKVFKRKFVKKIFLPTKCLVAKKFWIEKIIWVKKLCGEYTIDLYSRRKNFICDTRGYIIFNEGLIIY